ncbi:MAG: hypothetical protein HKL80_08690 [Acidimicrobiales bacterium]|nr:hypothetical protein [Acidimicrobiales bacterium]
MKNTALHLRIDCSTSGSFKAVSFHLEVLTVVEIQPSSTHAQVVFCAVTNH